MIRLGSKTSEREKNVTVVFTVSGCDVTNCETTNTCSTSTPLRVARLCQIREASLVALRKFHKSTLAHMCRSFDSSDSPLQLVLSLVSIVPAARRTRLAQLCVAIIAQIFVCVVTRSTTAEVQHNDMMMRTNVQKLFEI